MMDFDIKEAGKLIGLGKSVFTRAKTKTVKVVMDTIEDYENEYFANDLELARMVKEKQAVEAKAKSEKKRLDTEIKGHIDEVLRLKRGYDATERYEHRNDELIGLLRDCLHEFDTTENLWSSNRVGDGTGTLIPSNFEELRKRLGNAIKSLEGAE